MLIPFNGRQPQLDPTAYVQRSAQVIGDVTIGPRSSVWFNAVIRGDVRDVRIGTCTNVQDNATVHVTSGRWSTILADEITVAHGVILHGCRIGNRCLVGMGAIILDGVEIGDECLIAAGSLVAPGTVVPPGHLVMGSPAKIARPLRPEEYDNLQRSARHYAEYAETYRAQGIL